MAPVKAALNPETGEADFVISGDVAYDPRYQKLADKWRSEGLFGYVTSPHRRKESNLEEATRDVLVYLANNVPQDILAVVVTDLMHRLRKRSKGESRTRRKRKVEIYSDAEDGEQTSRYFEVEEDI